MFKIKMTRPFLKPLLVFTLTAASLLTLTLLPGCHEPVAGETSFKHVNVWPIFEVKKSTGIDPDQQYKWEKEEGNACCWLSTWEKEKRYDNDNFLIYHKERSGFFPICFSEIEETPEFRETKGAVLIFPNQSYQKK